MVRGSHGSRLAGPGVELIMRRGRVQGPVLGFKKFTSSNLHCSPSQGRVFPREPLEPSGFKDAVISLPDTSRLPRLVGVVPAAFKFLFMRYSFILVLKDTMSLP